MSKVTSADPNVVTQETVAANGQATDIVQIKKYDNTVVWKVNKDGFVSEPQGTAGLSASYIIFKTGSTYYAKNGKTGATDYSSATFLTVIQAAHDALTGGGLIILKAGDYPLATAQTIAFTNKVSLVGEGGGTYPGIQSTRILKTGTGWAMTIDGSAGHNDFINLENVGIEGDVLAEGGIYALHSNWGTWTNVSIMSFTKVGAIGLKLHACMQNGFINCYTRGNDTNFSCAGQSNMNGFYNCEFTVGIVKNLYLASSANTFFACGIESSPLGADLAAGAQRFICCWFEGDTVCFRKSGTSINNVFFGNHYAAGGVFTDDADFFDQGGLVGYSEQIWDVELDSFTVPTGHMKLRYDTESFGYAHEVFLPFRYGALANGATKDADSDTFTGTRATLTAMNDYIAVDFVLRTPGNYNAYLRVHDDTGEVGGLHIEVINYGGDGVVTSVNTVCTVAYGYVSVPFTITNAAYTGRTKLLVQKKLNSANTYYLDYAGVIPAFYPGDLAVQGTLTTDHSANILSADFAIDAVAVVTVTTAHGLLFTPSVEDISITVVESTNVDDWGYGYTKVESVDGTNVVCKVNVTTASATGGAKAKLGIKIDVR